MLVVTVVLLLFISKTQYIQVYYQALEIVGNEANLHIWRPSWSRRIETVLGLCTYTCRTAWTVRRLATRFNTSFINMIIISSPYRSATTTTRRGLFLQRACRGLFVICVSVCWALQSGCIDWDAVWGVGTWGALFAIKIKLNRLINYWYMQGRR